MLASTRRLTIVLVLEVGLDLIDIDIHGMDDESETNPLVSDPALVIPIASRVFRSKKILREGHIVSESSAKKWFSDAATVGSCYSKFSRLNNEIEDRDGLSKYSSGSLM